MRTTSYGSKPLPKPLYAAPGPMPPEIVTELVKRQQKMKSDTRKAHQAQRDRILHSTHALDIVKEIENRHEDETLAKQVARFADAGVVANPAADVVSSVVQIYRGGAVRRVEGASDEQQEAFQQIVAETGLMARASDDAQTAYFVGCKFMAPIVRRKQMRILSPEPQHTDEVLDEEDPTGDPVAIAYGAGDGKTAILDGAALRFYEMRAGQVVEDIESAVPHGIGDMPAAPLRFEPVTDPCDWWNYQMHERLRRGSLEVGFWMARLGLIRHVQGGKQLHFSGDMSAIAAGQPIGNPAAPLVANISDAQKNVTFGAFDLDTPPTNTLSHIRSLIEWMAESTGVAVMVESGGDKFDLAWDHDALAELRQKMLWWVLQFERQFWTFAVQIAGAQGHPLASKLPSHEMVAEGFVFDLPPLHRRFSDPIQELSWWKEMRASGQADYMDMARRFHPGLADKMLSQQMLDRIELNSRIWKLLSIHNTPAKPDAEDTTASTDDTTARPMRSLAQEQGASGGRPPNASSDDDGPGALDRAS